MAKKRPRKKRQRRATSDVDLDALAPDRRAHERTMADLTQLLNEQDFQSVEEANAFLQGILASGGPPPATHRTSLDRAQDIMYRAWEARGKKRVTLAKQALATSEDCADAYVLLAEETAKSLEEARQLYEQGVQAGERAVGQDTFEAEVGYFWGLLETRPYMRARAGLAQCLWLLGQQQDAIGHYQDMLRLNPGDNQGIRYLLASCLLEIGDDAQLQTLLDTYPDDASASWMYTCALVRFRNDGASQAANDLLAEAIEFNPFVPAYLLGRKRLPKRLPGYMGFGDENEAKHYAVEATSIWQQDPAALAWLREVSADVDPTAGNEG